MQRLMLPTDGSPESRRAVPYAVSIASANEAEVFVVQVVERPLLMSDNYDGGHAFGEVLASMDQWAQENLDSLSRHFTDAGVKVRATRLSGSAAERLLWFECEERPDLVVMSTHGRSGLARFALGSVADRMVRHGTSPVLLVRGESSSPELERAVVMLDGSGAAEGALDLVTLLAGKPLRTVKLFEAVADPRDRNPASTYLEGVAAGLAELGLQTTIKVDLGDPTFLIDRAAEDADFVILCTHGRGGLDRFRHGSVAERVVRESQKPVLLVRADTSPSE